MAKCKDDAFISKGFTNWRKGAERFNVHANSSTHKIATSNLQNHITNNKIDIRIDNQLKTEQEQARHVLLKLISSLRFLVERRLALRGHKADEGNYSSLLKLRAEDDDLIKTG